MKKIFAIFAIVTISTFLFAQAPQKMSYQAVIRNVSNQLVTNHAVGMKISILQGTSSGTAVYAETQIPTTNANGLVSIEIGGGTPVTGTFANIDWSAGPYFIKTETDPVGSTNYTITGTSQLLSVPYSLYASRAGNGFSGSFTDLTNKPSFRVSNSGDTLFLGTGIPVIIPGISAANPDNYVLNNIMSGLKIVEKLKPGSFTMTVNQDLMLSTNYNSCTKIGDYIVYTKTAESLDRTFWADEGGTAFTGDHVPAGLQIKFAWKTDGTVYIGAVGSDNEILATLVEGYFQQGLFHNTNTMFEATIIQKELMNLKSSSLATGIPLIDDLSSVNFYSSLSKTIFNRFSKPIFRVLSAVIITSTPANVNLWPEGPIWCPYPGNSTGAGTRSFSLSYSNPTNSYLCAAARDDNSNSSYIRLNGSIVAQMSKYYMNFYRRTALYPANVEIGATIVWSEASPYFRMAVVCDGITATNLVQTPSGGLSNNHAPIINSIPVYN